MYLTLSDTPSETSIHYPELSQIESLPLPDTTLINKVYQTIFSLPFQFSPYFSTSNYIGRVFEYNDSLDGYDKRLLKFIRPIDLKWMQLQDKRKDFHFKENTFVYKCLISLDSFKTNKKNGNFMEDFPAQFNEPGYNVFSLPLFSLDYRYFIIKVEYYCGPLCGEDALLLYKNEGGNFNYKETISNGIY